MSIVTDFRFTCEQHAGMAGYGWEKYDPDVNETLAILGISETGAIPGDHSVADTTCEYWNTILPLFPQV